MLETPLAREQCGGSNAVALECLAIEHGEHHAM